ncbi:unnamed protein product [Closterium sp. Yama58-4]|nr:unnamed protein product [Closterium sp. Yama58-4]
MGWRLTDLFSTSDSSSSATSRSQQTASHVSSSPSATHVSSTPSAVPSAVAPPGAAVPAPTSRAAPGAASQPAEHRYGIAFGGSSHMSRLDAAAAAAAAAPLATAPGATPAVIVLAPPQRPSPSAISPLPPSAFPPSARGGGLAAVPPLARPDASPSATPLSDAAVDTFFSPRDSFSSAHGFSARESSSPFSHHSLDSAHPSSRVSSGLRAGRSLPSLDPSIRKPRRPHDLLFLVLFLACLVGTGYASVRIGCSRWTIPPPSSSNSSSSGGANSGTQINHSTKEFWPVLMVAAAVALAAGTVLLQLLFFYTNMAIKVVVHVLTTYIAVVSVFCFWDKEYFWGIFFAIGAVLQFVYAIAVVDSIIVFCFWDKEYFWGIFFAIGAVLQFVYAIAVVDRIAYTMLVVRTALGFARGFPLLILLAPSLNLSSPAPLHPPPPPPTPMQNRIHRAGGETSLGIRSGFPPRDPLWPLQNPAPFPAPSSSPPHHPIRIAYTMLVVRRALGFARGFPLLILFAHVAALLLATWMGVWTFGVSGIMAQDQAKLERWWILLLFAMSIFWTAAVVCNMVHVVTAGVMSSWFAASSAEQNASSAAAGEAASASEEGRGGAAVPPQQFQLAPGRVTLEATWHALIGLGSICYGSLFSPPIRVIRWMIRGVRAWCIANECFFFIINLAFNFIEALTRAFNAFGFVTLATYGNSFNRSSVEAWELFQSTGVEAVIAYDLSGAVLLMAVMLAAMVAGTAAGVWGWFVAQELVVVVGAMGIVTGAAMAGVVLSVVEGAVTATYVTAAEDPTLIGCVDAEFAAQLLDTLHQRLQHRSGKPLPPSLASDGLVGGVPAT